MRRLDLKSKKIALAAVFCLMIHAGAGYSLHATGPIEIPQFQWVRPGSLILNPPDMGRIRAEDEQSRENIVPLRIGIHRELPPVLFDDGDIDFDSAGNMVWRLSITSSGAKNTRLYLVMSDLQVSDCVEVISDQGEGELYTREDTGKNSGIWTWSTEGETSLILWHHATNAGRTGIPDELPFRIVYLAHAYRNRPDQPDGDAREGN